MRTYKSITAKMKRIFFLFAFIAVISGAFGESPHVYGSIKDKVSKTYDQKTLSYHPWDVEAASAQVEKQTKKPYTIMVYMNGSDLESESGAATDDIIEILESGLIADNANIILFTGGTNRWQNDVIPENDCRIWEISDGWLYEVTGVGLVNMGDAGTLSSFVRFCTRNYPADKYGLIMWDHGGGAISGYGLDEKFNYSNLTLPEIGYAFEKAGLAQNKLEFVGFDSCLMATVEMAVIASDYSRFLIASEDLEPGGGWDYSFLSVLNSNPRMNGKTLGTAITDYYMRYYGSDTDEALTMSVTDLSNAGQVMSAMGQLMSLCSDSLISSRSSSFTTLARKRSRTKTFGEGSPRDNESDMVDVGDMAAKLSDMYPKEAANILAALEKTVVYNRHNSNADLKGLSTYYIYGGREAADTSLNTYSALDMDKSYTDYLKRFYGLLRGGASSRTRSSGSKNDTGDIMNGANGIDEIQGLISSELTIWRAVPDKKGHYRMTGIQSGIDIDSDNTLTQGLNGLWPKINGEYVCLYKTNSTAANTLYAIPAIVNDKDCDIVVSFNANTPEGKIMGIRYEDGLIIQKGFDKLNKGDKLAFYCQEKNFNKKNDSREILWQKCDAMTINGELKLEWSEIKGDELCYSLLLTDVRNDKHYTDLQPIR